MNPLDLKKVERVACRVSVQGGVSERVKWVIFLYIFVHLQLRQIMCCWQKDQRNFVLQKRSAERAGQSGDQRGNKRGSAEEGRHERQVWMNYFNYVLQEKHIKRHQLVIILLINVGGDLS